MPYTLVPVGNFPNETMALLFSIIFILFLIIELRIFTKQRLSSRNKFDKSSLIFILIGVFLPLIFAFYLAYSSVGRINTTWSYIGLIFVMFGFSLRQWSIKILGKFFTPVVNIQKDQRIIQTGPYKLIRHPSYTGLLIEVVGVGLFLSNWISTIIIFILLFSSLTYRIKIEEKVLINEFGSEYSNYIRNTKKLIPYIF